MRILITGARGTIGRILTRGLDGHDVVPADLPEIDVRSYPSLLRASQGANAVVHLAWDTAQDSFSTMSPHPDNTAMFINVYHAALALGINRVVMASSVHAGSRSGNGALRADANSSPDSPYGAHKVFMEQLGFWYSTRGLEVVCIRFGGVCPPQGKPWASLVADGLTPNDCITLVDSCLAAPTVPNNFVIIHGVSNNPEHAYDTTNPFGWTPNDDAGKFYGMR